MSILQLKASLDKLNPRDRAFAESLIKDAGKPRGLTAGQLPWVGKLLDRANGVVEPQVQGAVGNFEGVYALFQVAKNALKYPKIRLQVGILPVVLSMAGAKSKVPGEINVTDGGPFGNNKWYGRVSKDGTWTPGKDFPELDPVGKLLGRLAKDPSAVASEYGKLTGFCCFCSRALSDEKSTAVGYGATCAANFGLLANWKAAKPVLETEAA
jgi:hypothetical protein